MNRKGFTLIELVIVISVIGIIAVIVGSILLGVVDAWTFKFNRNDILQDGRMAIGRMTREMRTASGITIATAGQFRFIETENSGTEATISNDITYSLSGSNLNRTENGVANLLAENVSSLAFTYYDASETVTGVIANIRRVKINVTLTKNGENVYLQSESMPRNL